MANKLGFVAAVAQATPPPSTPKTAVPSQSSGSVLSPIDSEVQRVDSSFLMLALPMDKLALNTFESERRSFLFSEEYVLVQTEGKMVAADTFDMLRRIELAEFLSRAPPILHNAVRFIHRYDTAALIEACSEDSIEDLSATNGLFEKLFVLYELDDSASSILELVCFGLGDSLHFSELGWVVNAHKLYLFDSCISAGHAAEVEASIVPFIEYVIERRPSLETRSLMIASEDRIAQQASGSNICAFSATLCLGKMLNAMNTAHKMLVAEHGDEDEDTENVMPPGFTVALCSELDCIETTTAMYGIKLRKQAVHKLNKLSSEFLLKEKTKMETAKATPKLTGKKRPLIPRDDDSSEDDEVVWRPALTTALALSLTHACALPQSDPVRWLRLANRTPISLRCSRRRSPFGFCRLRDSHTSHSMTSSRKKTSPSTSATLWPPRCASWQR